MGPKLATRSQATCVLLTFAAVLALLTGWPVRAAPPATVASDRYVDGVALANSLTPWILQNTTPEARKKDSFSASPDRKLAHGLEFLPANDPGRVRLKTWMLAQPNASITPNALYTKAFEITGGDLQLGMKVVWDVLREKWNADARRNLYPHILKLVDITGELPLFDGIEHPRPAGDPREAAQAGSVRLKVRRALGKPELPVKTIRGDNFSGWYHFAGTALSAFLKGSSRLNLMPPAAQAKLMVQIDHTLFSNQLIDAKKRQQLDLAGVDFGAKLSQNLKTYSTVDEFKASPDAENTNYIYDHSEFYGPDWALKPGQHPRDFGTDFKTKSGPALLERFEALRALRTRTDSAVAQELAAYLQDPNIVIQEEAAMQLAGLAQPSTPPAIMDQAVLNPNPEVRQAFIRTLGKRPGTDFIYATLARSINDPDPGVRSTLTATLAPMENDPSLKVQAYFINSDAEALNARLNLIRSAKHEILFSTFTFGDDPVSRTVLAELRQARRRGVKVSLLIDDAGNDLSPQMVEHLIKEGIDVRFHHVVRNYSPWKWLGHYMHDKMLVVDGMSVMVGSRNMHAVNYGQKSTVPGSRDRPMRDRETVLTGSSIATKMRAYFADLFGSTEVGPLPEKSSPKLAISGPAEAARILDHVAQPEVAEVVPGYRTATEWAQKSIELGSVEFVYDVVGEKTPGAGTMAKLIQMINEAKTLITIEAGYLTLPPPVLEAMQRARARGVHIQIFTNSIESNNHRSMQLVYELKKDLLGQIATTWEQTGPETLHGKTLVIDGKTAFIGTANLVNRSNSRDTEMGVIIRDRNFALKLQDDIVTDEWMHSRLALPRIGQPGGPNGCLRPVLRFLRALAGDQL